MGTQYFSWKETRKRNQNVNLIEILYRMFWTRGSSKPGTKHRGDERSSSSRASCAAKQSEGATVRQGGNTRNPWMIFH